MRATFVVLLVWSGSATPGRVAAETTGTAPAASLAIRPHPHNPRYWQHLGAPVVLLGGSKDDNPFQLPDLEQHLDEIIAAGGNYVRNTMSDRRDVGFEVYPFLEIGDGRYDLERWNELYWQRFERFLAATAVRGMVAQIELWDRFDYSDHGGADHWARHPYNPRNNVNYTAATSGLRRTYPAPPWENTQAFFSTVPELDDNRVVLRHQRAQVDKLLSHTLRYAHVLYCIDNETSGDPRWSRYWADHLLRRAREAGRTIHVTEMWDEWDLRGSAHRETIDRPDTYAFVEASQNNHWSGRRHWNGLQWLRAELLPAPRPINSVKVYGADGGPFGSTADAVERFWRNLVGGVAAIRFHRPSAGLGLDAHARTHLRSARLLLETLDVFRCEPDATGALLRIRTASQAYLTREPARQYAVYFPDGGAADLDLSGVAATLTFAWLDVGQSRWSPSTRVAGGAPLTLEAPARGHWVAVLKVD